MKYYIYIIIFLLVLIESCKKTETPDPVSDPIINNFAFLSEHNLGLDTNIYLTEISGNIIGRLPYKTDMKALIASFNSFGSDVTIGVTNQSSGVTPNNFTDILTYDITNDSKTVKHDVDAILFTGIPIVELNIENNSEIISKEEYINGESIVIGGRNFQDFEGEMKIRGRGHSTWGIHPKKPYQMKLDTKSEFLGMPEGKKWIFLADYSDKTLIRTRLAFEMGYVSNLDWTPRCRYAEVFINNSYNGTYNITEKVEESKSRVNVGDDGYLLEIDTPDHLDEEDIYFNSYKFLYQIKEPSTTYNSPEYEYIVDYIEDFESTLFGGNFKDPINGYRSYIDVESFVDWYLINEIAKNVDARGYSSIYLNLVPGDKLKMGPLWDFDLSFGNVDFADSQYPDGFWIKYNSYFIRLFEDPYFVNQVKDRFNFFNDRRDYFLEIIDTQQQKLRFAQEENDLRWDLYGNYVWPNPIYFETHIEEVNHLKMWMIDRFNWLEETFDNM